MYYLPHASRSTICFLVQFRMMFSFPKLKLFTTLPLIKRCLSCYMCKSRFTLCGWNVSHSFFKLFEKIFFSLLALLFEVSQFLSFFQELQDSLDFLQLQHYQFFKYLRSLEQFFHRFCRLRLDLFGILFKEFL